MPPKKSTAEANGMGNRMIGHEEEVVQLQKISIMEFEVVIVGTSPLIVHKFSEKARKAISEKQQKKAKQARERRDPEAEYLAALYVISGTAGKADAVYGIPASGLKHCIVKAAKFVDGLDMTYVRGALHVLAEKHGLVRIEHDSDSPHLREDAVRLQGIGRPLDLRYRPEFTEWRCTLRIRYNSAAISAEQIVNLLNISGFSIGQCEWRPEKNGSNGMFVVEA